MAVNRVQKDAVQRKCPNCGAALRYDPVHAKLYCDHCKSTVDFDKSKDVVERDFVDLLTLERWDDKVVSYYRCANCGANTVLPRSTLATTCPYCSSPVVLDENKTGLVRPDTIVPFELSAEQAERFLSKWARGKAFAPRKFRRGNKAQSIKGVYTPAWTFDLVTFTHYEGRLGRTRTRTVIRDGESRTETYVEWFNVDGTIDNSFDDIFVSGNNHISVKDFNALDLTNQAKYSVYTDEYLAGYIADNYTVEPDVAYGMAVNKAKGRIYQAIVNSYGADHDGGLKMNIKVVERSFKYVMLPVYVVTSKYRNKVYNQYVSGVYSRRDATKVRVSGKAPVSPWKVLACVLAGLGALIGIIAFVLTRLGDFSFDFGDFFFKLLP